MTQIWQIEDLLKRDACPGCGIAPPNEVLIRRGDDLQVRRCTSCALLFVDPAPSREALLRYYDAGYFNGGKDFFHGVDYRDSRHASIGDGSVTGYRELAARFELKGKTILDIGCATGALLQSLKSFGPARLIGIDVAESALAYGRERYDLDLRCTDLEHAKLSAGEFDLIVMIDVIEHLRDLRSFFGEVSRIVKRSGAIFISTPNAAAFKLAGNKWAPLHVNYEHVLYLSDASLASIIRPYGLKLETFYSEGSPVNCFQYYGSKHGRFARIALQPHIAALNCYVKWRYGKLSTIGGGAQLNALLRKP